MDIPARRTRFLRSARKKLRRNAGEVDLIVISANSYVQSSYGQMYKFAQEGNFFYLTGLSEPGLVLVIEKDEEYLIVPDRNEVRITFEGDSDHDNLAKISGIENIYGQKDGWRKLSKRLRKSKRVGILKPPVEYIEVMDAFSNPARKHLAKKIKSYNSSVKLVDLRPQLMSMRMIKSTYEIRMIQEAIKHTKKLFAIIERKRQKAGSEQELLAEITRSAIKQQLDFAYDPIIASGKNAVTLHYIDNNSLIDKKKPLLLDIGLKYEGYAADVTRTVLPVQNKRQRQIYEAVLAVQEYAIGLLKPGVNFKEYEEEVFQFMGEKLRELGLVSSISKEEVRKYYPHSTSHFLGVDVHDLGDYERPLQSGMVLTVEPGIYIAEEEIGIRIEDDVLITKDGNKVLTNKLPKNPYSLTINP